MVPEKKNLGGGFGGRDLGPMNLVVVMHGLHDSQLALAVSGIIVHLVHAIQLVICTASSHPSTCAALLLHPTYGHIARCISAHLASSATPSYTTTHPPWLVPPFSGDAQETHMLCTCGDVAVWHRAYAVQY